MTNSDENAAKLAIQISRVEQVLAKNTEGLIRNTMSLEEHARRCDLLEAKQDKFDMLINEANGAIKFIKFSGGAVAFTAAIIEIIRYFK